MTHTRSRPIHRAWLAGAATLLALLALAACGATPRNSQSATPSGTSGTPNVATILQEASQVSYNDVAFTFTLSEAAGGQTSATTGTGKATKNPKRSEIVMSPSGQDPTQQVTQDTIFDVATKTSYTKKNGPGQSGAWTKASFDPNSSSSGNLDIDKFTDFTAYKDNAHLVGAETVDSIRVWHIQVYTSGVQTATAGNVSGSSTVDIYIRQDNHFPAKFSAHSAATSDAQGTISVDETITFTQFNSGASIALPQV